MDILRKKENMIVYLNVAKVVMKNISLMEIHVQVNAQKRSHLLHK